MADFRRWFYALALVALLAGLTVPASAQVSSFQCIANAGVPPIVRFEGYTEQVGDITLNCTGGIPTPANGTVPQVNFTVGLNTNITSRLLAASLYNEALLIVDEPHSAVQPLRNILNCGAAGAPDVGASGPGVCSIISDGNPADTYNGVGGAYGTSTCSGTNSSTIPPSTGSYGCGRPNVFQGRIGTAQNTGQANTVTFLGVPMDPPGTNNTRTIRITNIRADANYVQVSTTFSLNEIIAQISVNGNTSMSINNPQQVVAYVENGLSVKGPAVPTVFLQCNAQEATGLNNDYTVVTSGSGVVTGHLPGETSAGVSPASFTFTEGFASSWKTKNISYITNQAPGNGVLQPGNSYWTYNQTTAVAPPDLNQNVPGAIYNTESGFEYPSNVSGQADPSPNPPTGTGTVTVGASAAAFSNAYNTTASMPNGTGITGAGIASQGTRLALQLTNIPNGSVVLVPTEVLLTNSATKYAATAPFAAIGPFSGVAVLVSTDAFGAGAFSQPTAGASTTTLVEVPATNLIVYEVLFADPFSIETAAISMEVAYPANLAQNLPAPGVTAQVAGGFAPFYSRGQNPPPAQPSATLPIPRFIPSLTTFNLYTVSKCACDILFPFVSSAGGYDTGIAIANTSLDPGAGLITHPFGFSANPQTGGVQFWFYGQVGSAAAPGTMCTNLASPGTCPPTPMVPGGAVLTYVLSSSAGGVSGAGVETGNGLAPNWAAGFQGYIIAQTQFQYCHAFAFITALGAGPLSSAISEGYLGLIMDPPSLPRSSNIAEALNN
jgi:hypothetical protein